MSNGKVLLLVFVVAALAIAAAQSPSLLEPKPSDDTLEIRILALESRVAELEDKVVTLEKKLQPRLELLK